nr:aminoglycoside phosphotransferase family protein [Knoellia sp. DB2414S]
MRDHSWGLVDTHVLEVVSNGQRFIVKAAAPGDRHLIRELRAHREWLEPWRLAGRAPVLEHADDEAKLIVTRYLSGRLVEGTSAQDDPDTYRQAGRLLSAFHEQYSGQDAEWNERARQRVLRFLDQPHRIERRIESRVRSEVSNWAGVSATVVPTHGDWQPRNWLTEGGEVRAIDFGRADLRPADEDFVRLARQDFARNPLLETAFLDGYGHDPRQPETWCRAVVGEAVATAVWAYHVGDEEFEEVGHAQLRQLFA